MLLNRYYDGVEIHRKDKIIYARFLSPHRVTSTCPAAGGVREDIEVLYNHQSCFPEFLYTFTAQIAAAVSGRYDQFDRYRRLLFEKEPHLNGNDLTNIIYIALASGFADKWRFESKRSL